MLLSGNAGIGKTTLMSAGIEAARRRGYRVVSAHPSEVETGLAFAALGDLLAPLLETPVADLPEPQREALDVALLRASAASAPDPLGVSLATVHVLRDAAVRAPLLVAIDDVPWLDEASVRALDFAVRRLQEDRVGLLLARRAATPDEPLPQWLAGLPPDRLRRLDVGPLSMDDTDALLRRHLELSLTHPVLARLHAISGGTPFYAIELGRDLQLRGSWATPESLEVPRSLERLVGARVAALDPAADEVALHAAALAQPTVHVLVAALGAEQATAGLDGAPPPASSRSTATRSDSRTRSSRPPLMGERGQSGADRSTNASPRSSRSPRNEPDTWLGRSSAQMSRSRRPSRTRPQWPPCAEHRKLRRSWPRRPPG